MTIEELKRRIQVAAGREPADLVIRQCRVVNVFTHEIECCDVAVADGVIAGLGSYDGKEVVEADGRYLLPGYIDSHIHIESSFLTPEEFGAHAVPHGATTAIADPHEIANVCGMEGIAYMCAAAEKTAMDIRFMAPSCVPATEWEDAGAVLDAAALRQALQMDGVYGVGEFMNTAGLLALDEKVLEKIIAADDEKVRVDGHSPGIGGKDLNAYFSLGIATDHESGSAEEVLERLRRGVYAQLRYGSACHELPMLLKAVTPENARRCLLCSDDRQAATLLERGEMDDQLRICVENGLDPVTAVQMATLNAAECYGLNDRGAIAPGRRADMVLVQDLKDFKADMVWIEGRLTAKDGRYLLPVERQDPGAVASSVHVKDFSEDRLKIQLKSDKVHVIDVQPGTVLTADGCAEVARDENGFFRYDPERDVAQISVIERHRATGRMANALIRGYGIRRGAVAVSVGHDSHNLLVVGPETGDMAFAVERLMEMEGGIVLVRDGKVLDQLSLPVAGLMSDRSAEEVRDAFRRLHSCAIEELGVNAELEPILSLCFMSLPVIPTLKLTDQGLFNVLQQRFIQLEWTEA